MPQEQILDDVDLVDQPSAHDYSIVGHDPIETARLASVAFHASPAEAKTAPSLALTSIIAEYKNTNDQLESGQYVEPTYVSDYELGETLRGGQYSIDEIGTFMRAILRQKTALMNQPSSYERTVFDVTYTQELSLLTEMPSAKLRELYVSDEYGAELQAVVALSLDNDLLDNSLIFFEAMYGCRGKPVQLGPDGALADPIARRLFDQPKIIPLLTDSVSKELAPLSTPDRLSEDDIFELMNLAERRADQILNMYLGPEFLASDEMRQLRHDMCYLLSTQSKDQDTDKFFTADYIESLGRIAEAAQHFGPEKVLRLRKEAGIVGLNARRIDQMDLMLKVLWDEKNFVSLQESDPETFELQRKEHLKFIEELQKGDVTVVFNDEMGDYNGAFNDLSLTFATAEERTLTFGIHKPSDMYLYLIRLKKLGIAPSTIVVGAHGSPGKIHFQKPGAEFAFVNGLHKSSVPDEKPYDVKKLARIFNMFMQDSKGNDEHPSAKERRRIIITSCFGAAEADIVKYVSTTRKDGSPGKPRAVHLKKQSTAKVMTKEINRQNTDVFAARVTVSIPQITDDGYSARVYNYDPENETRSIPEQIVRHYLNENGRVIEVEEATLKIHVTQDELIARQHQYDDDVEEGSHLPW